MFTTYKRKGYNQENTKKVVRKEMYNCCLQQISKNDITKKTKKKVVRRRSRIAIHNRQRKSI